MAEIPPNVLADLNKVEAQFHDAEIKLLEQQVKLFTPLYEKRDPLVRQVPKFWATVFEEADDLSELIGVEDQQLLSHLVELKVRRDNNSDPRGFTISMEFEKDNGYLPDDALHIKKTFTSLSTEKAAESGNELASEPAVITWQDGKDLTKDTSGRPSFFTFFAWTGSSKDVFQEGEEVALILADQLYPDALKIWTDSQEIDSDEGSIGIESDIDDDDNDDGEEDENTPDDGPAKKKLKQ